VGAGPASRTGEAAFLSAIGFGQICSWGTLYYAFPLIATAIERDMGWSRTAIYGAATAGLLLAAAASYPIGRAIDRGQGRLVMAGGSVLAGLMFMTWSQVNDLIGLYAVVGMLGALQAATLYEAAFAVVTRRVGALRARGAITAVTLWGGFASTVFIPIVQPMIDAWGWRAALLAIGGVNVVVCAGLYAWAIRPSRDAAVASEKAGGVQAQIGGVLRSPVLWLLVLSFTMHAAVFSAFTFHLYPLLLERGYGVEAIVLAMALIGPAQVGGRVAITLVARRASISTIGVVAVIGFPAAILALIVLPASLVALIGLIIVYSLANGILTIVRGAAVPEMLTRENYGAVMGLIGTPMTVARALAPVGAAALWSVGSAYDPVVTLMMAGSLVLAGAFWAAAWLARRRAGRAARSAA
jgi:predicted MFS family arabinose efflux permease